MGCVVSNHTRSDDTRCSFSSGRPLCHLAIPSADFTKSADVRFKNTSIRVYLSQNGGFPGNTYRAFSTEKALHYDPLCDDFGPMNIMCIIRFIEILDRQVELCSDPRNKILVYCTPEGPRALTNAVLLLGSYMLLRLNLSPSEIAKRFRALQCSLMEGYRDATYLDADFRLSLLDCWEGLHRGKMLGWLACPKVPHGRMWGQIDLERYTQFDNPLGADLNEVVPGKYIAFRGPTGNGNSSISSLKQAKFTDHALNVSDYLPIFKSMGVSTVIRLNEAEYDREEFIRSGFDHIDLPFDDCTPPNPSLVTQFLAAADAGAGLVAVHCRAGLGRTGTLIAVDMMRSHGFAAREAIAWLRILRPGSVIAMQQHYLCSVEKIYRRQLGSAPNDIIIKKCSNAAVVCSTKDSFNDESGPLKVRKTEALADKSLANAKPLLAKQQEPSESRLKATELRQLEPSTATAACGAYGIYGAFDDPSCSENEYSSGSTIPAEDNDLDSLPTAKGRSTDRSVMLKEPQAHRSQRARSESLPEIFQSERKQVGCGSRGPSQTRSNSYSSPGPVSPLQSIQANRGPILKSGTPTADDVVPFVVNSDEDVRSTAFRRHSDPAAGEAFTSGRRVSHRLFGKANLQLVDCESECSQLPGATNALMSPSSKVCDAVPAPAHLWDSNGLRDQAVDSARADYAATAAVQVASGLERRTEAILARRRSRDSGMPD